MAIAVGKTNNWQTTCGRHRDPDDQQHVIAKCGSHTGHMVTPVAFCADAETAEVLVNALALLKLLHDDWMNPSKEDKLGRNHAVEEGLRAAGNLLDQAGLL